MLVMMIGATNLKEELVGMKVTLERLFKEAKKTKLKSSVQTRILLIQS